MAAVKRPISEIEDENRDYEIEAILEHRSGKKETDYKIRWKDGGQISWEPRSNITNGEDILAEYWAQAILTHENPQKFCQENYLELGPWYKSLIVKVGPTSEVSEDLDMGYQVIVNDLSNLSESDRALVLGLHWNVLEIESKLKQREHPKAVVKIARTRLTKNSNGSGPSQSQPKIEEAVGDDQVQQDQSKSADRHHRDNNDHDTVSVPTSSACLPLNEEASDDDQVSQDRSKSADPDYNDSDDEAVSVTTETLAFPCNFHGCKKSFSTNKGRLDHGRYHRVMFCKESSCKWKGPVKRFNKHLRDKHAEINGREGIIEARKKAGLSPTK